MVDAEVRIAKGRADAVEKTTDSIYVFEFKMDKKDTAEGALAQIDTNGYLIPYIADSRRLVKVGVELNIDARGITRWVVSTNRIQEERIRKNLWQKIREFVAFIENNA